MSLRLSLARVGFRWRLAAALLCLLLAAVSALESRAGPAPASSVRVVVTTRALAAGHRLATHDLAVSRLSRAWPGTSGRVGGLVGRTLAGPVAKGEPLTPFRLIDRSLSDGLGPGFAALPIDVAGDVRGLVRPGLRVDVYAVPDEGGGARVVARRVLVLAVLPASIGGGTGSGTDAGCRLVLAVERESAARLSGVGVSESFRVAALPP